MLHVSKTLLVFAWNMRPSLSLGTQQRTYGWALVWSAVQIRKKITFFLPALIFMYQWIWEIRRSASWLAKWKRKWDQWRTISSGNFCLIVHFTPGSAKCSISGTDPMKIHFSNISSRFLLYTTTTTTKGSYEMRSSLTPSQGRLFQSHWHCCFLPCASARGELCKSTHFLNPAPVEVYASVSVFGTRPQSTSDVPLSCAQCSGWCQERCIHALGTCVAAQVRGSCATWCCEAVGCS